MTRIKGKAVSPGIVSGPALLYASQHAIVLREKVPAAAVEKEVWRFNHAARKSQAQLKKIHHDLQRVMGQDAAFIIETQYMLLKDSHLLDDIRGLIRKNGVKAEWAVKDVEEKYLGMFRAIADLSFKQKSNDIADVLNRLQENLVKKERPEGGADFADRILVADDLSPSEAAKLMSQKKLLGLVLNKGGETSHTVILARALGIPALVDTGNATGCIANDDWLSLDSIAGEVLINPTRAMLAEIAVKKEKYQAYQTRLMAVNRLPDLTRDKQPFHLYANIELPFESENVQTYGAKGVGLFRTEFLYLDARTNLSADEQHLIYKDIAQRVFPHPLVVRTFDIGRDKIDPATHTRVEENPSLGLMAMRMFLRNREPLCVQVKAILRANTSGNIRILFPMITEIEEVYAIRDIIRDARAELERENRLPKKEVPVGIMLEIPAAITLIRHLKGLVDFFSVGTNDLTQYLLAVDRNNRDVAYLFNSFHPGVVQALRQIREETARIGRDVTVCGEMAGSFIPALMLLGMGYTRFSMNPLSVPEIKRVFTSVDQKFLRNLVRRIYGLSSHSEIEEFLTESLLRKYPDLFLKQHLL
jgi:phosphoenolpyruvate-protein phosphotransferase (PTS system enzyme I)